MAVFGCIADDFTGASDAASFLVKGGMSVRLYNGIPERPEDGDSAQAIVIAFFLTRVHGSSISSIVPPSIPPRKATLGPWPTHLWILWTCPVPFSAPLFPSMAVPWSTDI